MHADKINRAMLLLLAVVFLAVGGGGLVAGSGLIGSVTKHEALTHNRISAYVGHHGEWLWPSAAVGAAIIVLLSLRWLVALLFSTDRSGDLRYRSDNESVRGYTLLSSAALTSAVAEEISAYRGVHAASARLIGEETDPELVVGVSLEAWADLAGLRRRIETQALSHARQATGKPDLPIQLNLAVTTRQASRAR